MQCVGSGDSSSQREHFAFTLRVHFTVAIPGACERLHMTGVARTGAAPDATAMHPGLLRQLSGRALLDNLVVHHFDKLRMKRNSTPVR